MIENGIIRIDLKRFKNQFFDCELKTIEINKS